MRRSGPVLALLALLACGRSAAPRASVRAQPEEEEERSARPEETTSAAPAPASPEQPPRAPGPLACVASHYVGTAAHAGGAKGWMLRLPGGAELAWDDGAVKTFEQKLAAPDLEDTLSIPYATGPIAPVTAVDHDPGRIRSDVLFKATFGGSEAAVRAQLVDVDFVGQKVKFHTRAAPALSRVSSALTKLVAAKPSLAAYVKGALGGTFHWRPIVETDRLSSHSYGIAIDVVTNRSNYWEWDKRPDGSLAWTNRIPEEVVEAFEAEGFVWGGRWYHYDTMHFEYRPELFDEACAL